MRNWRLYWHTVRHLRRQQLVYQVINRLRSKPSVTIDRLPVTTHLLKFPVPDKPQSLNERTFTFLNQSVTFPTDVDWNYTKNGKLWQYNLNYFDFLNQADLAGATGLDLIRQFIGHTPRLNGGLEPYPTSLRIINWIRFLSTHQLQQPTVDAHLWAQVRLLEQRLEYHLLGNHLLENGFALLIGSLYFQDRELYQKAIQLVKAELTEQLHQDGGHYEHSPMYHQILLDRLLDVGHVLRNDTWHRDSDADGFLSHQAERMLSWLAAVTFANGNIPLMNDAAEGVAPTTTQLIRKAQLLGIEPKASHLSDSGFRRLSTPTYEMLANVGMIGPDHQPGHAHADTFSFELYVNRQPVLIDAGTSTYEASPRRQWERSTAAHNTVQIDETDSSEVWGGFRVGRRARVTLLEDLPTQLGAQHNGYQHLGIQHKRQWISADKTLAIVDSISGPQIATARFYLAPGIYPLAFNGNQMQFLWGKMEWQNALSIHQKTVQVARQFNRLLPALMIEVQFRKTVRTIITCAE
ncbi:heparinase II/III family protein [Larkinella rosea]|uniref:Heparinase n=1 Tax=Larkinella rosea TaxID=2025312 RepID=A0A3P1BIR6_9BACT|nr:heparinase II/III family protein [Larkinella rosea]RRB00885.1 heparinase [Larkinella rosea]